jgi:hypothetical protein
MPPSRRAEYLRPYREKKKGGDIDHRKEISE